MPYCNFEENTKLHQLKVWHTITTIRVALEKLDKLSFLNNRREIRLVLNSISANDSRYSPFYNIACCPSNRFNEGLICYNMTSGNYMEIFNSLYKALSVDALASTEINREVPACKDSYDAALESYFANLLRLKKDIHAGVGAYDRDSFEELFSLTWK
ncbi:hypothetical protein HMPREF1544_11711, partial [Mucor circinelloides 1006PhL]